MGGNDNHLIGVNDPIPLRESERQYHCGISKVSRPTQIFLSISGIFTIPKWYDYYGVNGISMHFSNYPCFIVSYTPIIYHYISFIYRHWALLTVIIFPLSTMTLAITLVSIINNTIIHQFSAIMNNDQLPQGEILPAGIVDAEERAKKINFNRLGGCVRSG